MHRMSMGDMMKKDFATAIGQKLSLPAETIGNVPLVEIRGNRSVCVENHRGIEEYSDESIRVNVKKGEIRIFGSCLTISCMNHRRIEVQGRLTRIELEGL